jgi:hypothetical protein
MFRLPRIALVLLLAAVLSTTAVLAASDPETQPRRSVISISTPIDLVCQLWSVLTRIWSKNGSEVDPDGIQIKNGSQTDPSGLPTKNGSQMDPDGRTLPTPAPVTPNRDNGHQVDPSG